MVSSQIYSANNSSDPLFFSLIPLSHSKYPLLFKNLLEMTPEGNPERANIDQCCSLFEDIVMSINQAKDESMNASALAKYDEIIEGYPVRRLGLILILPSSNFNFSYPISYFFP